MLFRSLASLGLVFDGDEMHDYFINCSAGRGHVSFEGFIRFMVEVTEDQNTAEQVFQSFQEVADGKPYVTEMDLRHSLVPDDVIEKLVTIIPPHKGPDLEVDRGMPQYDYIKFMGGLIDDGEEELGSKRNSSTGKVLGEIQNKPRSSSLGKKVNGV